MTPFERLRYLARSGGSDAAVVEEAADCLAGFADDPAGLVVACRRLLAHHPEIGPLWWLCARVLTAPDPGEAAWKAWERVHDDPTAERAAERLPFPADAPVAVLGSPELVATIAATRPDLDLVAVRGHGTGDHARARRARRADPTVAPIRIVDPVEASALAPSHVLLVPRALSPQMIAVTPGTGSSLDDLGDGTARWLVGGAGRVLPDRLFDAFVRAAGAPRPGAGGGGSEATIELVAPERFERVVVATGLEHPSGLARRVDCPAAPELLRPAG